MHYETVSYYRFRPCYSWKRIKSTNYMVSVSNIPVWGLNGLAMLYPVAWYSGSLNKKNESSYCRLSIKRYICSAQSTHRHCKRAGHGIIEKHRQFYYGSLHIISVMCGLSDFEPYRTVFLFNSSNCSTQMNQSPKAAVTPVTAPVRAGKVFTWRTIARFLNAIPLGVCECKTVHDAKMCVYCLVLLMLGFVLAGIEKGGVL